MNIIIIGGGAAGCFAAIEIKRGCPNATVTVLERGPKALAKVAVTGGGRCNVTNSFAAVRSMEQVYPRGHRLMRRLMHHFSHEDTYQWFEKEGVALVTQEDDCVFPQSQDAMQIVNTLLRLMGRLGVRLVTNATVTAIRATETGYNVETEACTYHADRVAVTTGGQPKATGFHMLDGLNIDIVPPVPSLFSIKIADRGLTELMGTVVERAQVSLVGTKLKGEGPVLVTHWGLSGPATLKLSSAAARVMAEHDYSGMDISVNWLHGMTDGEVRDCIMSLARQHPHKMLTSVYPEALNARLWQHIIKRSAPTTSATANGKGKTTGGEGNANKERTDAIRWEAVTQKALNRIVNTLTNDVYRMEGKNRFKEEFVTCGGVALTSLRPDTLEAKEHPGLYFAGEVTDVDAVTGGFNLQAAWTMAYVVAKAITAGQ